MPRILIVEDEQDLAQLLVYNLKQEGFETDVAGTGAAALLRARQKKPDLVLLDLMLPDISGTEVVRQLKADPGLASVPVFIVTAKGQEEDRILGLELGADDYMVKPFSVRELILRARAILRRVSGETEPGPVLEVGPLRLDIKRHQVTASGQDVELTALEFRLLKTLMERLGRVQTRDVLLADVWGIEAEIVTRTVDTHMKRLREKLGSAGDLIETVRGVGYKLRADA